MTGPLDPGMFDSVVASALDAAAERSAPLRALDTRYALLALMQADTRGEWDRVWLHFAGPEAVERAAVTDPDERQRPSQRWGTAALSGTCADALAQAVRLADIYGLPEVSPGIAAIGLVADPATAAAMALTGGDLGRHAELLDLVQSAVLGAGLERLDEALRGRPRTADAAGSTGADTTGPDSYDKVVHQLGGASRLAHSDGLALFAAALRANDDAQLTRRYDRLLLDDDVDEVRPLVVGLASPTAAEVVERAKDLYDTQRPNARQLIVAATHRPGEQLAQTMWRLGLPANVVAFEAAAAQSRVDRPAAAVGQRTVFLSVLNALASVSASILVGQHAWQAHHWWPDLLIAYWAISFLWSGNPLVPLVLAPGLWFWAGVPVAVAALGVALVDALLVRSELNNALRTTGIALTLRQLRWHKRIGGNRADAAAVTPGILLRRWRRMPEQESSS